MPHPVAARTLAASATAAEVTPRAGSIAVEDPPGHFEGDTGGGKRSISEHIPEAKPNLARFHRVEMNVLNAVSGLPGQA